MKKFEVGKVYKVAGVAFEITKRTAKRVKYIQIQHYGRFNERRSEEKSASIYLQDYGNQEVFFTGLYEVEA